MQDNLTQWGDKEDKKLTRVLEEALLAVSDGAQQIENVIKDIKKPHLSPSSIIRNN